MVSGDPDTVPDGRAAEAVRAKAGFVRGTSLGRYLVLDKLGEGGMGVVYAAYDPDLHRKVALKLLRPRVTQGRLLREAQAMARLSHPNVIHVYDVGTFEDHVFLALEFIDGENLARWIKREKPGWRDVLRVYRAAGRGLAAAHAAGLVHRDFKPDNVLLGRDGRVLVTDFGLARAGADEPELDITPADLPVRGSTPSITALRAPAEPGLASSSLSAPLTQVGTVIGTAGYAAPETLDGATADARSDQFSFAAALYAGLYKKRPYPARSFREYKELLAGGLPAAADGEVPAWVRRIVERGLARDPAARFPSVEAMLDELARDPAVRRRRIALALGATGAIAAAAVATTLAVAREPAIEPCRGAEHKLAGVWDAERKAAVQRAFLATKRPFAQAAFDGVAQRLDARASAWTAMHVEACEATQVRREQLPQVMTLRIGCLDRRLREERQLVDVFVAADGAVVEKAVQAVGAMGPLEECADVARLTAVVEPPDPAVRDRVEQLRGELGRAKALSDAGKYKDADVVARQVDTGAKQLGYKPLEGEALALRGEISVYLGDAKGAAAALRDAIHAADASRDDATRARAFAWLVGVVGFDLEKPADGLELAGDARAALDRLGGDPRIESQLENSLGRTYSAANDYAQMLEHHRAALALRRRVFGEADPVTANSHNNVAAAYHSLGKNREALAEHQVALAAREAALGPEHPSVAMSRSNIASQYFELGELDLALRDTDAALALARKSLPEKSTTILAADLNRACILAELGRLADAKTQFDDLLAILRADFATSSRMVRALAQLGGLYLVPAGQPKDALAASEAALAIAKPATDEYALAMWSKGAALAAMHKPDAALAAYRDAIATLEKAIGRDASLLLDPLTGVGEVELVRNRPAEAQQAFESALALCERSGLGGKWLARTRFALARALEAQHKDPQRARELAKQAREWYATVPTLAHDLTAIDAWLARR